MSIFDILIAVLLGVLAFFIAGLFLPHTIAVLIGLLVGALYLFGNGNGTRRF